MSCEPIFFCNYSYVVHTEYIYFCITVQENRMICCQIFCDLLLKSAFERIFNYWGICLFHVVWTNFFFCNYSYVVHILFFFINWTLCMSDNLPERVQILVSRTYPLHYCTGKQNYLLSNILRFAQIFNVMQLILGKIKWHITWKYLIQKFHDICLSYYFKGLLYIITNQCL
jgi:hypothetical protein